VVVLSYVPVVEVGNAHVEQNTEQKGKVENGKIQSVFLCSHRILYTPVDTQYPKRLDKQIQKKQNNQVGNEFFVHTANRVWLISG